LERRFVPARTSFGLLPALSKKVPDQVAALIREDTANDVGVVIET
jgi:hypothetical protein